MLLRTCPAPFFVPALMSVMLLTSACSSTPIKEHQLRSEGVSFDSFGYFRQSSLEERFGAEWTKRGPAKIGLALAGGGTKAADFALGVLQGLHETNVMRKIDVLSTVSGGGYAALWYYLRLSDSSAYPNAALFDDCAPIQYLPIKPLGDDGHFRMSPCPRPKTNYSEKTHSTGVDPDGFRYQNYLRGYQDVLSSGPSAFNYDSSTVDNPRVSNDIWWLIGKTVLAIPLNSIANGIFDWEVYPSPSRTAYRYGIARTFGASPPDCDDPKSSCTDEWRPEGDVDEIDNLSFDRLRELYEAEKAPLWIINATAGEDRTLWDFEAKSHPEMTVYEFTPYGRGSGLYGYSTDIANKGELLHDKSTL